MKYPNIKPQQGEEQDVNQRRYPDDNIEIAGKSDQETSAVKERDAHQNARQVRPEKR